MAHPGYIFGLRVRKKGIMTKNLMIMRKKRIKDDYKSFSVAAWMVNRYNLNGLSLLLYAIIFSQSQGFQYTLIDYNFIKAITGMTACDVGIILENFKQRGMIEFDGLLCKIIIDE
jgi:hypothetical protein